MTRRFDAGPILVALGAILLLVSLFLEWFGPLTAWDAFELVDVLLAALAVAALVVAAGLLAPEIAWGERRWLPAIVLGVAVLVASQVIDPPPAVGEAARDTGAWLALAAALIMLLGAVLSLGRVSFAVSVEGRPDRRERVPVIDHRQDTTESAAVVPDGSGPMWRRTAAPPPADGGPEG
jgi:hypothetical protein